MASSLMREMPSFETRRMAEVYVDQRVHAGDSKTTWSFGGCFYIKYLLNHICASPVGSDCRLHRLYLCKESWSPGECGVLPHCQGLLGQLCLGETVPNRVLSMGKKELFDF